MEMSQYPSTPELNRMSELRDEGKLDQIQTFIDWLMNAKGYDIVMFDSTGENIQRAIMGESGRERLMAEFFAVDMGKVEAEKKAVLAWVRERSKRAPLESPDSTG